MFSIILFLQPNKRKRRKSKTIHLILFSLRISPSLRLIQRTQHSKLELLHCMVQSVSSLTQLRLSKQFFPRILSLYQTFCVRSFTLDSVNVPNKQPIRQLCVTATLRFSASAKVANLLHRRISSSLAT